MKEKEMKLSIVLPIRKGSQRAKNKNIKPFTANGKSLTQLKVEELLKIKYADEIVITSNYEEAIEQVKGIAEHNPKLKIDIRPDSLCQSTTRIKDLIDYMPTICSGEHILWLHVTSPFVNAEDYDNAIVEYFEALNNGYDSIMSVTEHKQFIWSKKKKKIINTDNSVNKWPNTQDLEPVYEINHAFYINSRISYMNTSDRIGSNPYLYILEGEKTIDVDWDKDFIFAQKIFKAIN
ncbi:acylneuraminate cytidylyltransferase family protein [Candidatus Thioglobus sp.]|nr:acylneuraminate cytidylyltransferase family protein [Candidatus Thioglobus sp.]MDC1165338.1 acylneuraminate cytidylyltransferase family protein [Candidatus Thioglobus sp.]